MYFLKAQQGFFFSVGYLCITCRLLKVYNLIQWSFFPNITAKKTIAEFPES